MYIKLQLEHELNQPRDTELLKYHNIMITKKSVNSSGQNIIFTLKGAYNNLIKYLAALSDLPTNAEEISNLMEDGW